MKTYEKFKSGRSRVTHRTCDGCQAEMALDYPKLTYRKEKFDHIKQDGGRAIVWDVCATCILKVKELLGSGRDGP